MKTILTLILAIVIGLANSGCRMAGNSDICIHQAAGGGPVIIVLAHRTDQNAEKTLSDWLKGNKADIPLVP